MGKYRDYVEQIKREVEEKNLISDIEKLRYVYISLGKKLDFNLDYTFGNSKQKKVIYNQIINEAEFDKMLETHRAICKNISFMYEHIMRELGVNIYINKMDYSQHVNNEYAINGQIYVLDIENDLEFIQSGAKTHSFLRLKDQTGVSYLSEQELRRIDRDVVGYIPQGLYLDDMIWMLQKAVQGDEIPLDSKVEFVLNNLNVYTDMSKVRYRERINYQARVLQEIFSRKEMNKIHRIDCIDDSKEGYDKYIEVIVVEMPKKENVVFIQSEKEPMKFERISMEALALRNKAGMEIRQGIPGLKPVLRRLNKEEQISLKCSLPKSTDDNNGSGDGR